MFAFKELLRFYKKNMVMHVAFLDASKAFDRVNKRKLLLKLESRGVPTYMLRLLSNELIGQYKYMCSLGFYSLRISPHWEWSEPREYIITLTFNVYMDDLSLQLHRQPIGCNVCGTVVNHMLYADDIVLFAPSAKGLQKLLDLSHTYGCNHDIEFNPLKSSVMYIDSRKAGYAQSMTIGGKTLNTVASFSYVGHRPIICNDLYDDADLKAKCRQMYAKSNTLRQKFHMCSTAVKVKLFTAYFSNVYMCALWVNYRKTTFHQFTVALRGAPCIVRRLSVMLVSHCREYMTNGLTNAVRHEFVGLMIANDRETFVAVRKHSRSFLWCFECYVGLTSGECMANGLTNAIRHQFAMIAK